MTSISIETASNDLRRYRSWRSFRFRAAFLTLPSRFIAALQRLPVSIQVEYWRKTAIVLKETHSHVTGTKGGFCLHVSAGRYSPFFRLQIGRPWTRRYGSAEGERVMRRASGYR